jgi:hypothetical protein
MKVVIDNQMVVIQEQIRNKIVKNVLLNGGSNINIIIEQLKLKLRMSKPKPAPYDLRMSH